MRRAIKVFFKGILLVILLFIIFYFIGGTFLIKGRSMLPKYREGQQYVSLKIVYWFSQPKRGDVVIYISPKSSGMDYIGRIIALPGERINIDDGKVYINNQILSEPYLIPNTKTFPDTYNDFIIDANSYFIMGDSRFLSDDSRHNGVIKSENIKSKVVFKIGK